MLQTELSGDNVILLETGDDDEGLVETAKQMWATWGETERAWFCILAFPRRDTVTDATVFQLWSIGPEMTVVVPCWQPSDLACAQQSAYGLTRRLLQIALSEQTEIKTAEKTP